MLQAFQSFDTTWDMDEAGKTQLCPTFLFFQITVQIPWRIFWKHNQINGSCYPTNAQCLLQHIHPLNKVSLPSKRILTSVCLSTLNTKHTTSHNTRPAPVRASTKANQHSGGSAIHPAPHTTAWVRCYDLCSYVLLQQSIRFPHFESHTSSSILSILEFQGAVQQPVEASVHAG